MEPDMGETKSNDLKPSDLVRGATYNWRFQEDKLIYLGKNGPWHRFSKVEDPRRVWCEVMDEGICLLEETRK